MLLLVVVGLLAVVFAACAYTCWHMAKLPSQKQDPLLEEDYGVTGP